MLIFSILTMYKDDLCKVIQIIIITTDLKKLSYYQYLIVCMASPECEQVLMSNRVSRRNRQFRILADSVGVFWNTF